MTTNNLFTAAYPEVHAGEIAVTYSYKTNPVKLQKVGNSKDVYEQFLKIWSEDIDHRESFYILLLNRANRVLGYAIISQGGMTGTIADPKIIFQVALKTCACGIILAHNHPSGNIEPSAADIALTYQIKSAGEFLDISVLDHLIITSYGYYSFCDEGRM